MSGMNNFNKAFWKAAREWGLRAERKQRERVASRSTARRQERETLCEGCHKPGSIFCADCLQKFGEPHP